MRRVNERKNKSVKYTTQLLFLQRQNLFFYFVKSLMESILTDFGGLFLEKFDYCNAWLLFYFLPRGNKVSDVHLCKRENVTTVFSIHNDL